MTDAKTAAIVAKLMQQSNGNKKAAKAMAKDLYLHYTDHPYRISLYELIIILEQIESSP